MTEWYADYRNIATLARWMLDGEYDAGDVLAMLEKPWAYTAEFTEASR